MKTTYKQRIFGYFLLIFILFAVCVVFIEQKQVLKYRTANLESRLDGYTEMIFEYIQLNNLCDTNTEQVSYLAKILPPALRISVIDSEGKVLFDNDIEDISGLDNHLDRPEIRNARYSSYGSNIRMSASMQQEYLYYAKYKDTYYVRVAYPYNILEQLHLKSDNLFIYSILVLFFVVLILINYVSERFSSSIIQLRNFASAIKNGYHIPEKSRFPEDELGEIGKELTAIFSQMEMNKHILEIEQEKLIRHFRFSREGICFYTSEMIKIYANTNFIQYLNLITDKPTFDPEKLFTDEAFKPILEFIKEVSKRENHFTYQIAKNGKIFSVQTIVFKDDSFEVTIKDITNTEKTHLLKQEMTSNIAHELRTPVTSLRGYLETLYEKELTPEKQKQFIDRAFVQSVRLSNLIEDVSIISKMEEAASKFTLEDVNLFYLIEELRIDLTDKLEANRIKFYSSIKENLTIEGNYTLLYSIFRNLADNTISYAGQDIEIHIDNYMEDDSFLYFSYYDTGKGVEEQHLSRLFERFYRINEGRTRDTGGSGLGLSIVKNAIVFHKGSIQVKNHFIGGLKFLFTLKKSNEKLI